MRINVSKGFQDIGFNPRPLLIVFMSILIFFGFATKPKTINGTEFYKRGIANAQKGLLDQAISDFNKALEIDPSNAGAYYNRGVVYYQKGLYDQAISDFSKVLEISPRDAKAYCNRGTAYYQKGLYEQAISDLNNALEIDPTYTKASYNLRLAYAKSQHQKPNTDLNEQLVNLKKEPQIFRDENEIKMAMLRGQNALLKQQLANLKKEIQSARDENAVLAGKLRKLQLKYQTLSSKSSELKKEDHRAELMYIKGSSVRVRSGPGTKYRIVSNRRLGDKIFTKDGKGDWKRIVDPMDSTKTIGWIHTSLVSKMPPGQ